MKKLSKWYRAVDILDKKYFVNGYPDIATHITGYEIMQKGVGDCSVLSSLAVSAHHEFKSNHSVRLISNNIYPQDQNGKPIYNPEGKYIVKLKLNGNWRSVEIDDHFPIDSFGDFICSYSNKGKMWVSIMEKAYVKAHGGYNFPGSNSSRDLYILTGWLPEIVHLKEYDRQKLWTRIHCGYQKRNCLITCSTGSMQLDRADSLGLVSGHAYAILEVEEFEGTKLLMVKNPWGHKSFKGKFSVNDTESWTPPLK